MANELIISSDSHVFEPPDLWTKRIDKSFRDRAPRLQRIGDVDKVVLDDGQPFAGIGLISNAGARFEAPETISDHGRFEEVHAGGYDPDHTSPTWALTESKVRCFIRRWACLCSRYQTVLFRPQFFVPTTIGWLNFAASIHIDSKAWR